MVRNQERCHRCCHPRHEHPTNTIKAHTRWVAKYPGIIREGDLPDAPCCLLFREEPDALHAGGIPREGHRQGVRS